MGLKVFNTLSRSLQDFVPLDPAGKKVGLYCCGPTVHDFAHIGNFRTFVFADLVRRYLGFRGYAVTHVMNITDVEDKIIRRVREQQTTLDDFTRKYEAEFLKDLAELRCVPPHHTPRATAHIAEMIDLIGRLLARGIAYQAADGSIYFSIEKYRGCGCCYGQLVNLNFEGMRVGERVASDEYAKESLADFALWKARVPEDGAVFWPSPWGEGRPGWHIECSAMSMKILGPSFDLHLGGEDLMFPHHEDEIAQSEGAAVQPPGQRFVKYWMHGAHLLVEGKKMSKSLGNFFTLRDLLAKGFTGREIRFVLLSGHYREQFNFTLDSLAGARAALARLDECSSKLSKLAKLAGGTSGTPDTNLVAQITAALDEDLNVSGAWGTVFEWVREINSQIATNSLTPSGASNALAILDAFNSIVGLADDTTTVSTVTSSGLTIEFTTTTTSTTTPRPPHPEPDDQDKALLDARQAARKAKDFAKADALRLELKAKGWLIEDTPKGPRLKAIQ
jgi:cysteinyl-tRNA synthetase